MHQSRVQRRRLAHPGRYSSDWYVSFRYCLDDCRFARAERRSPAKFADSPQVQEWLKELDGVDIPDISPTVDGSCAGDPQAASEAQQRGWWTCGGYTSGNDIVACPDKLTWVSVSMTVLLPTVRNMKHSIA